MALGTLSLSITAGRPGRPFEASVIGLTTGRVEIGGDATPGFSYVNGRLSHPGLPSDRPVSTVSLIEYDPGATVSRKETRIDIAEPALTQLGRLSVAIPDTIAAAGSAVVTGAQSGSTLTLATNPDGAWSLSGSTLSWSSAAIGKTQRPVIVEIVSQAVALARSTSLGPPPVFAVSGIPANAILNASGGYVLNSSGGYVLNRSAA